MTSLFGDSLEIKIHTDSSESSVIEPKLSLCLLCVLIFRSMQEEKPKIHQR